MIKKSLLLSLAALCCTPLFAQHPAAAEPTMPTPPQHQQEAPMRTVMDDGSMLLCDSTVTYNEQDKIQSKREYIYDAQGRVICETSSRSNIIWQGVQSAGAWDDQSLRFSDYEGKLPYLSHQTYQFMVGCTMCLVITEVNGDDTWIRVTDGWWSEAYVPDTPVHAGETFRFEFTQLMADRCEICDLMFLSNNGLTITKFYIEGPDFLPDNKYECTYDANGNQTSQAYYNWLYGAWRGSSKYEHTYDANGNQTSQVYYDWQDGTWVFGAKHEYTYDANGNQASQAYYYWRDGAWVVEYKYKYESTYDANGKKTSEVRYNWRDGEWVVRDKSEYTYDVIGNQTSIVSYSWLDGAWVGSYKGEYEYTYYASGHKIILVNYFWQDDAWVPNTRAEWTYDANGIITTNISYHHWEDGVWLYGSKEEWTYDANGNRTSWAEYYWRDGAWVVEYKHKYENTYDANGKRTSEAYYNWQNDEWVLLEYTLYYYSLHTPEFITQITSDTQSAPRKQLLPDGRMVIIRDGRSYNVSGQMVK